MKLVERIVALHDMLDEAEISHAFGGALALAWCTQRARATIDIDLNVFIGVDERQQFFDALPAAVAVSEADDRAIVADGQTRLWWDTTPLDVFFNTTGFHDQVAQRARIEPFGGADVPFLACRDLAVFKAFFNRTKDWADLEEMAAADALDIESVLGVLVHYIGGDDERVARLRALPSL